MPVDFKGSGFTVVIPGDRGHRFALPHNRETLPAKTSAALDKLTAAMTAESEVKPNASAKTQQAALDATRGALNDLYDTAAATSSSRRQHHEEGYSLATAKLNRALTDAEAALQALIDHASQAANPVGVGLTEQTNLPALVQLRVIAAALAELPAVPALDH